jgi:hypothetical protein
MCVPLHLILQQARPYGSRMFKEPDVESEEYSNINLGYGVGTMGRPREGITALKENEYRFWRGSNWIVEGPDWGQCRSCMVVCRTEERRKEHQKTLTCTKELVRSYKLLLVRKICVVCRASTTGKKWGIPMCVGGTCREDFKTQPYMHGLQQAINKHATL